MASDSAVLAPAATSAPALNKLTPAFWVLACLLIVYVALCTGRRDLIGQADAWEHHRAIKALSQHLGHPGNPTFATEDPSVRYSPYTVTLALIARATGADVYPVLSAAAVFNTALFLLGVALFLKALGRGRSAATAVVIMVSLYGGAPGYANSYALADLPWHEVNPSAFAFGCALVIWTLFLKSLRRGPRLGDGLAIAPLLAGAILDHAMTGIAALVGLMVLAWLAPAPDQRRRAFLFVLVVMGVALVAGLAWPWYSFLTALRRRPDNGHWFNPWILRRMLTEWCAPGMVLGLFALTSQDRRNVRILLTGAATLLALGLMAMLVRSAALARLPLPGLIFSHLALALYADDSRMLCLRSWPARISALRRTAPDQVGRPVMETVLAIAVVGCLTPQLRTIMREPYLARPLMERLLGRPIERVSIRERLDRLLAPIGERDVVLSDSTTSWPIPSSRGRVVTALHYELFVPDQHQRELDVKEFFDAASDRERLRILARYDVRWILIDRSALPPTVALALLDPRASVGTEGTLVLMDAQIWQKDRRPP